jgi:hypothetical protein
MRPDGNVPSMWRLHQMHPMTDLVAVPTLEEDATVLIFGCGHALTLPKLSDWQLWMMKDFVFCASVTCEEVPRVVAAGRVTHIT